MWVKMARSLAGLLRVDVTNALVETFGTLPNRSFRTCFVRLGAVGFLVRGRRRKFGLAGEHQQCERGELGRFDCFALHLIRFE